MKKQFEKHETLACILLIVAYVTINSYCIQNFGLASYQSVLVNTGLSLLLLALMTALGRLPYYGLTKARGGRQFLFYIPLVLISSVNLWNGLNIQNSKQEILFHILSMLNVGFLEEVIFRGFLYRMMAKDNEKSAAIVSALTFGIGHIVNLLNGASLVPTLMQICYAVALGYLFVVIFQESKSLVPCILAHGAINCLSIFNKENTLSVYIAPILLVLVPVGYVAYIRMYGKKSAKPEPAGEESVS